MRGLLLSVVASLFGTCLSQFDPSLLSNAAGGQQSMLGNTGGQFAQSSFGNNAGSLSGLVGSCTARESREAFNSCMYMFGIRHMRYFRRTRQTSGTCQSDAFNCHEVDELIRCLNSQPTTIISNRCWLRMEDELTNALTRYFPPCKYHDLEASCLNAARLIPPSSRPRGGSGQNTHPLNFFFDLVRPLIPMVTMLMANGGSMLGNMVQGVAGNMGF